MPPERAGSHAPRGVLAKLREVLVERAAAKSGGVRCVIVADRSTRTETHIEGQSDLTMEVRLLIGYLTRVYSPSHWPSVPVPASARPPRVTGVRLISNWFEEIRRLAPTE